MAVTYHDRILLSNPRSDKPQNNPANSNSQPETSSRHSTSKSVPISDLNHKGHDPPA